MVIRCLQTEILARRVEDFLTVFSKIIRVEIPSDFKTNLINFIQRKLKSLFFINAVNVSQNLQLFRHSSGAQNIFECLRQGDGVKSFESVAVIFAAFVNDAD